MKRFTDDPLYSFEESNRICQRLWDADLSSGRTLQSTVAMSLHQREADKDGGWEKYLREKTLDEMGARLIRELLKDHAGESVRVVVSETKASDRLVLELRAVFHADLWRLKRVEAVTPQESGGK